MTDIHPGEQLDHYRIEAPVGSSGMATIFRATDVNTGHQVAIKIPHFEMESDPVFFDRFRREEQIGKALDHPAVMKVMTDDDRSRLYIVMEWVEGKPLRQILNQEGKLPAERASRIVLRICDALGYIHSQGVTHRDLKPENIMLDGEDNIKLIDFGIAAKAGARRLTFGKFSKSIGTPEYVSPEQIKGKRGDARSDLYSLGVILYEMLIGEGPFSSPHPSVILHQKLRNNPPRPRDLDLEISPGLQEIICRAMERDPNSRYASAREFAWDLEHQDLIGVNQDSELRVWEQPQPSPKRRMLLYSMLAMIPVVIFLLLLYVARKGS